MGSERNAGFHAQRTHTWLVEPKHGPKRGEEGASGREIPIKSRNGAKGAGGARESVGGGEDVESDPKSERDNHDEGEPLQEIGEHVLGTDEKDAHLCHGVMA